jgi:hypothetical protein
MIEELPTVSPGSSPHDVFFEYRCGVCEKFRFGLCVKDSTRGVVSSWYPSCGAYSEKARVSP